MKVISMPERDNQQFMEGFPDAFVATKRLKNDMRGLLIISLWQANSFVAQERMVMTS